MRLGRSAGWADDHAGRAHREVRHSRLLKVDVEGYELQVLEGLGQALPALSFEFTFERIESRLTRIGHVAALGIKRFNFSVGEAMRLEFDEWVGTEEIIGFLQALPTSIKLFGDVYAAS